jgi:hypothetical protein
MALSPGTKQIIDKWVREHCPSLKCAACSGTSFEINDILVCNPKTQTMGALTGRGPTYEFVSIVCGKCGLAMFFSVKTMGLTV